MARLVQIMLEREIGGGRALIWRDSKDPVGTVREAVELHTGEFNKGQGPYKIGLIAEVYGMDGDGLEGSLSKSAIMTLLKKLV